MRSEFSKLCSLISRNIKVYFKDKMLFFVSLITPMILVILFITFLGSVYEGSLLSSIPEGVTIPSRIVKGFTGGWLFSSIMATSCITVAFCSNVLVNDKVTRVIDDFNVTPVKKCTIQLSYFISNFFTTIIVCSAAFVVGLIYLAIVGWYLTIADVLLIILVMILNTLLGTLLASIIEMFIKSQGVLSAICTLVSSMYGFLCGAYMPLSQFSEGIRTVVSFLPATYSTVLFRQFYMRGTTNALADYLPKEAVESIKQSFDGKMVVFNTEIPTWAMFTIVVGTIVVLFGVYLLANYLVNKKSKKI